MRHRDKPTAAEALHDWKRLRKKVEENGGENYEKPVLVQFLDANTFEVMDRDIVEDEFYVLRKYRIVRELDAAGKDLEDAIRQSGGERRSSAPGRRRGERRGRGDKPKPESQKGEKRSGQKRRKRRPRRAGPKKDKPPTA
jgi:hypothetical protein